MNDGSGPAPRIGAPTLLCGFPKSGTTLLAALLDGHPDLLLFPEETWALKVATRFPREEWLEHVIASDAVQRLGQGIVDSFGGARDYSGFDFPRFTSEARTRWAAADGTPRALMESLMAAFSVALAAAPTTRWAEKSPEHELELERHAADWQDLRVVHVVRDPRAVLCSFRRKRERSGERIYVDGLVRRWRAGIAAAIAQEQRRPGSVRIVRYEDVVLDHRATMEWLLAALSLDWDAAVESPTLLGRPWAGNSMYQSQMTGVSGESLQRWTTEIDARERALIDACLAPELEAFGYEVGPIRPIVRDALPLILRQREGIGAKGRAFRRLLALRDASPAPVTDAAFLRARSRG